MKVLFDYKIFYLQKFGGISNYFYNLGSEFLKLNVDFEINSFFYRSEYLKKFPNKNFKGYNINFFPGNFNFFFETINRLVLNKKKIDILNTLVHETYYSNHHLPDVKKILTVYDMITEIFPNNFHKSKKITQIKKKSINEARHIICISESCKKDLIKYFNIDPKIITVTYLGSNIHVDNVTVKAKKLKDIILFVGSRRGYKHFPLLVEVFSKSKVLKKNFRIGIFGGEKFSKLDFQILKKFNLSGNEVFIFDEKKISLEQVYSNVAILVYPSAYEGFGLPVVEAMSCGCPVLCGSGGSLVEVGGDGLEYLSNNIEHFQYLLEKILDSDDKQKELIDYGYQRSKKFSWKKCALETIDIYKKVLKI
jgi:glycosyltransferase involved in cell wall biosynthesis